MPCCFIISSANSWKLKTINDGSGIA
jgi:hypothetical protein